MRPPIPPPEATPAIKREREDERVFRYRFWPLCLTIAVGTFFFASFLLLFTRMPLRDVSGQVLILSCLWALISTPISMLLQPTRLTATQLHSHDFWGLRRSLDWVEMQQIRKIRLGVVTYLRISTVTQRNLIWLPLCLRGMPRFAAAVREFAPPENPLRRYFDEHPPR